jgi:hypothetical protein
MWTGLLVATVLILALFSLNWQRAHQETEFDLTPNCLLTRHPIAFLTGHRSLFYFLSYWNEIPAFLTAHGYQIYVMPLPWKPKAAKRFLNHYFHRRAPEGQKFHFVIDPSLYSVFEDLLQAGASAQIASVTCIGHLQTEDPSMLKAPLKSSLKGLQLPIEDVEIPLNEIQRHPWWWKLHLAFTGQSQLNSLAHLGWPFVRPQYEVFLKRATALAERDLIQGG